MNLREAADRYGPTAVIVIALAVLVVALPSNKKNTASTSDVAAGSNSALDVQAGGATADTALPGVDFSGATGTVPGGARAATGPATAPVVGGQNFAFGKGDNCRAPDGRQKGISRYNPPCAQWLNKDNGGATAQGVTKDKVLVVRFISQVDPATQAILQGAALADDPAIVKGAYDALFKYHNQHYETWGREVVFQDYNASGPDDNDEQMQNDAVKIATDIKPFAVWGGTKVFGQELAQRGIVCICTVTLSSQFYQENPSNIWGSLPTSTEYAIQLGEYIGKRLANKPAKFAGDELNPTQQYRTKTRKWGLIYLEGIKGQVDPEGKRAADALTSEMAKYNVPISTKIAYTYDPGRNQQDLTTMISKMHNDGITSIIMFVDPLYPILITGEATRQQYYPEWVISGSGLSDTTAAGRLYDQQQWKHAFGISPLWVTWTSVNKSTGYRETHHGNPNMAPGDEGVLINIYQSVPTTLFRGIMMAGPKLSAQSFAAGMFAYPKTGGTLATPLVYFTRAFPTAIKDFMEIYYDSARRGVDERGLDGTGMIMKMNGGKRYLPGQWPAGDTAAFNDPTAVGTTDVAADPDHEQDGHTHPATQKCLSC